MNQPNSPSRASRVSVQPAPAAVAQTATCDNGVVHAGSGAFPLRRTVKWHGELAHVVEQPRSPNLSGNPENPGSRRVANILAGIAIVLAMLCTVTMGRPVFALILWLSEVLA